MPEIARINKRSDCFELDFVEREATAESSMKLSIHLHLVELSLLDIILNFDSLGVNQCLSTVHNWVQKAGLQPREGADLDHVVVDETVI